MLNIDMMIINSLISIHALHEESDSLGEDNALGMIISIHALHEESDQSECLLFQPETFQSTLSMRRAT